MASKTVREMLPRPKSRLFHGGVEDRTLPLVHSAPKMSYDVGAVIDVVVAVTSYDLDASGVIVGACEESLQQHSMRRSLMVVVVVAAAEAEAAAATAAAAAAAEGR